MKSIIVRISLSLAIVSLSTPIIHVFRVNNSNLSAGIMKSIGEVLNVSNEEKDPRYTAFAISNVNIRNKPDKDAEIIDVLPFNDSVSVFDYDDEWVATLWCKDTENNENKSIAFINKKYISDSECSYQDYNLYWNSGFKSYMPYKAITNEKSDQYRLQQEFAYTGNFGIRQVNGRYCVAIGTAFNVSVGTYFDLILENETIIQCIASDIKSQKDTFQDNITTSENGCVSEFVVDTEFLNTSAKYSGDISSCCEEWDSPVKMLRIYDKNIFD